MTVTGYRTAFVAVLIGGNDFKVFKQDYDPELAEMIKEKCIRFWEDYVLKDIAPPPTSLAEVKAIYQSANNDNTIEAESGVIEIIKKLSDIKQNIKNLKNTEEELQKEIMEYMKENSVLVNQFGDKLCTWKGSKTNRLDTKALKKECPEIAEKYIKTTESRRFIVK
jgi:predicted phage-related endonuclease